MIRAAGVAMLGAVGFWFATGTPESHVRAGNAAFHDDRIEEALLSYERAAERTTDPGLVAFNTAAALYRLGRHREAELHFCRSREDAAGPRRTRLLFGLGNSLMQRSAGRDGRLLDQAMRCYEEVLQATDVDEELTASARHNLELARLLRPGAREDSRPDESRDPDNGSSGGPSGKPPRLLTSSGRADPLGRGAEGGPGAEADGPGDLTDQPPPPGQGNLPVLPDSDQPATLTRADAAALLTREAERIGREQQDYRRKLVGSNTKISRDW
jgi:hypothetical protein